MGIRPKQTLLQRIDKDGQQAHEKMLNTNCQRNPNQNYNEVPPYMGQNGHHSKNLQITNAGEGVEKREPSNTGSRKCKFVQPLQKTVGRFLKKIKNRVVIFSNDSTRGHISGENS